MDVFNRKLYKAVTIKAHTQLYELRELTILILAATLEEANRILLTRIGGYKRHREKSLEELDFKVYFNLSKIQQKLLFKNSFIYIDKV